MPVRRRSRWSAPGVVVTALAMAFAPVTQWTAIAQSTAPSPAQATPPSPAQATGEALPPPSAPTLEKGPPNAPGASPATPVVGGADAARKGEPTTAEVLELQNKKFQSLESFARVLGLLETMYVEEASVKSEALIEKAIKGMVSSLDPHTVYLPAAQLRDLTNDTSGKFGGIGVILQQQEDKLEVVEVIDESPAARGGIIGGDIIYAVDGLSVNKANMDEVLNRMRGLPGSSVTLELVAPSDAAKWSPGSAEKPPRTRKVTVTREIIRTQSVTHTRLSPGYAYVKVAVFQEDVAEQVDKAMRLYEAENGGKLDGMVLDLRGNPGGLLDQAVRLSDLFLDSGIIVSTIGRDRAKQEVEYATKRNTHPTMPLVVLVNEGSASASEIVAGALQDHNRALVVGSTSFGKGSVQSIVQLPNGAGLKMTIARYYTPKGRSIQAKGITPDIPIPASPVGRPVAGSKGAASDREKNPRKESDLEGHIDAADLDATSSRAGFNAELEKWPVALRSDNQLLVSYTYLRSWSRFSNARAQSDADATKGAPLANKAKAGVDAPLQ
jgi:carboxyl-terminal processing protease